MALRDLLRRITTTRRFLRALDRIAAAQEQQVLLLQRLADHFAPIPPPVSAADLKSSGASFNRDEEQVKIQKFIERCQRDLHREPTEEEIVDYLDGVVVRLH